MRTHECEIGHNEKMVGLHRKGKITLVHSWTFGCINCKHNLPAYARLQKQFAGKDVQIIGVHTPETAGEANLANCVLLYGRMGLHTRCSSMTATRTGADGISSSGRQSI
jgi:thiol-disulfide isomerase/thioredoxin